MFWDNEGMSDAIYLDGVVCVVDGVFGLDVRGMCSIICIILGLMPTEVSRPFKEPLLKDLGMSGCVRSPRGRLIHVRSSQVASADVVLLNKSDLASSSDLSTIEKSIRRINAIAPIRRTTHGKVEDLTAIIGLKAYGSAPPTFADDRHDHDHDHDHADHDHFGGITSILVPLPAALTPTQASKLDEWVRTLLWEGRLLDETSSPSLSLSASSIPTSQDVSTSPPNPPLEILRLKALYTTHDNKVYVIQGVQSLYDTHEVVSRDLSSSNNAEAGKVALIGTGLGEHVMQSLVRVLSSA